jgi:flagella basal body P-ring formation protein FlgA
MLLSNTGMKILAGFMLAAAAHATCLVVPSDKIFVRDLAAAIPLFRAADAESVIGFSPFPGTTGVLSTRDILLAARRYGLAFPAGEPVPSVCVKRLVQPLSPDDLRAALTSGLGAGTRDEAHLEILGFSNKPFPPGHLVFELSGLNRPPPNQPGMPVIWTGKLIYDGHSSLSVWAEVRVSVKRQVPLAKRTIAERDLIQDGDIVTVLVTEFPWPAPRFPPNSAIAGKAARHTIPAGTRISWDVLDDAAAVRPGDLVHVKVISGGAIVSLDAVVQSSGTKGEKILVHSLATGKPFRAVVEDREHVIVNAASESTSVVTSPS